MKKQQLMVVEDNSAMRLGMVESLRREGFEVSEFENGPDALKFFGDGGIPLVITDLKMEPVDGITLLREIKKIQAATEVIVVSAFGTVEVAVKAMQLGAADFLTKPFSTEELRVRVNKVWERIEQQNKLDQLMEQNRLLQEEMFDDMIGSAPAMMQLFDMIHKVSKGDSTILLEGESGAGKELAAQAIHRHSNRAGKPFIKINCGALNDNLLESELFGHEKGAFTGAIRQKKGRFELADRGTLFLDEIGDISSNMQVKLLRVIQEKSFERVGGEQTIFSDVRIICATNRNLPELVRDGKFREDLFYRLSVIPIKIPTLRERKEDIPALAIHFLGKRKPLKKLTSEGLKLLMQYSWPGNIRELENLMERLQVISPKKEIDPQLIAAHLGGNVALRLFPNYDHLPLEEALNNFEKSLIVDALKKCRQIKNRAAKLLGVKTSTLYYKMEKHGLFK